MEDLGLSQRKLPGGLVSYEPRGPYSYDCNFNGSHFHVITKSIAALFFRSFGPQFNVLMMIAL